MNLLEGKIIAVDFDGTIVRNDFPRIGEPIPNSFDWLERFKMEGAKLILWTNRSDESSLGEVLTSVVNYCKEKGVVFDGLNKRLGQEIWSKSPKVYADYYIDDRAVGCPKKKEHTEKGLIEYVDWDKIGQLVLRRVLVAECIEFPTECPENCPCRGEMVDQNSICTRCPIFCCVEKDGMCLIAPEGYRMDWAIAWKSWFDGGCNEYPELYLETKEINE